MYNETPMPSKKVACLGTTLYMHVRMKYTMFLLLFVTNNMLSRILRPMMHGM